MKTAPGYPLPTGTLGNDDIVCQLVFLPDRPEYWQAFLGALSYMSTWRAWERDDDKRGKDAAANWREAYELTMECWRMACLEELQDNVAEILAIMQLGNSCCDDQDVTHGDQYTDRVEDGVGDVPQNIIDAGYATGVSDWAGFADYKCMIAHVTVDQLPAKLDELNALVNSYGAVAGGAAAIAGILAVIFGTGGLVIAFGMIAGVGAVSLLYEALMDFPSLSNLAAKVVTNHDELACSVYSSDGDVSALVALNSKIDALFTIPEALILKNMNLGPTLKALYAGRYDQQDIADILDTAGYETGDFDCTDCGDFQVGEYFIEMPFGRDPDETHNFYLVTFFLADSYFHDALPSMKSDVGGEMTAADNRILNWADLDDVNGKIIEINRISFWYYHGSAAGGTSRLQVVHDGGVFDEQYTNAYQTWTYVLETFSPPLVMTVPDGYMSFKRAGGTAGAMFIDDIIVDFDSDADPK